MHVRARMHTHTHVTHVPSTAVQCIVTMNVVGDFKNAHFSKSSPLAALTIDARISTTCPQFTTALQTAGFTVKALPRDAFQDMERGKLLINLFNAVNGLSGVCSIQTILSRGGAYLTYMCVSEAVAVYRAKRVKVPLVLAYVGPLLMWVLSFALVQFALHSILSVLAAVTFRVKPCLMWYCVWCGVVCCRGGRLG